MLYFLSLQVKCYLYDDHTSGLHHRTDLCRLNDGNPETPWTVALTLLHLFPGLLVGHSWVGTDSQTECFPQEDPVAPDVAF